MKHEGLRLRVILHLLGGGTLVFAALLVDTVLGLAPEWGRQQTAVLVIGIAVMLAGVVPLPPAIARVSTNLCAAFLSVAVTIGLTEVVFRAIGYDFAHEEAGWRRTPPYFRQPTVPIGDVFFRRPGPETWTGQVLNTRAAQLDVQPNVYADERVVTVRYDEHGFRNHGLKGWEIAITGDSFTELGYLADEEIFTTQIAEALRVRVLNLGTSYTGPLTQLSYLQDYGVAKETKQVVLVFFEGNDLADLEREARSLERFKQQGVREYLEFKKQTSALRAIDSTIKQIRGRLRPTQYVEAYFASANGEVPVTLTYTPSSRAQLTRATLEQLDYFARSYASFAKEHHLTAWIVYMPCKTRVLHGQLRYADAAPAQIKAWTPTDLPEVIHELSTRHGLKFADLTPALTEETRRTGTLLYNSVFDSHLNGAGSAIVARTLANELGREREGPP